MSGSDKLECPQNRDKTVFKKGTLLLVVGLTVVGCEAEAPGNLYLPLEPGSELTYLYTRSVEGVRQGSLIVTNKQPTTLGNVSVAHQQITLVNASGTRTVQSFLQAREDGIYIIAAQYASDPSPQELNTPELLVPSEPQIGQSWPSQYVTQELILMSRQSFTIETVREVVSLSEQVITPFGTLENCLVVTETGEISIPRFTGNLQYRLRRSVWYAPGIGRVKELLRIDGAGMGAKQIGESIELVEVKRS